MRGTQLISDGREGADPEACWGWSGWSLPNVSTETAIGGRLDLFRAARAHCLTDWLCCSVSEEHGVADRLVCWSQGMDDGHLCIISGILYF